MMKYGIIADFLSSTIGLEPSSLGESGLAHAAQNLMKNTGCENEVALLEKVKSDTTVLDRLITATTVPETWFFREPQSFAAMEEIATDFYRKNPAGVFRILSMACCSGEEPYSAAMVLTTAGVPKENYRIDAFDINIFSLEAARRGIYNAKSFRQSSKSYDHFRSRYFTPGNEDAQFILDPEILTQVNFSQGNLTDPCSMPSRYKYNMIFCRNVMIYLNAQARQDVLDYIQNSLFV
ncbi:MAG TPA: CheR family methyltransferase, partial [Phycisphaerae bacterium]|nr:CheR family methyltransferase [Phycisphaerae bacterium]